VGAGPQFNCWRYPPAVIPTSFGGVTAPPAVTSADWCGEFVAVGTPTALEKADAAMGAALAIARGSSVQ
jgi:hypothetical protein